MGQTKGGGGKKERQRGSGWCRVVGLIDELALPKKLHMHTLCANIHDERKVTKTVRLVGWDGNAKEKKSPRKQKCSVDPGDREENYYVPICPIKYARVVTL